tara:strand:+ start:310 stop:495 length:186 start_codon:yes stop_codon:yes gene_type:complete
MEVSSSDIFLLRGTRTRGVDAYGVGDGDGAGGSVGIGTKPPPKAPRKKEVRRTRKQSLDGE